MIATNAPPSSIARQISARRAIAPRVKLGSKVSRSARRGTDRCAIPPSKGRGGVAIDENDTFDVPPLAGAHRAGARPFRLRAHRPGAGHTRDLLSEHPRVSSLVGEPRSGRARASDGWHRTKGVEARPAHRIGS